MTDRFNLLYFPGEGPFTRIDAQVRVRAMSIKRRVDEKETARGAYCEAIRDYISSLPVKTGRLEDGFRKRTASQILSSEYLTGCSDAAIAFSSLARALRVPVIYVETFEKAWVEDLKNFDTAHARTCRTVDIDRGGISYHSFVDVRINNHWHQYEPKQGSIPKGGYVLNGREYLEVGRGLDFGALYLKENDLYRSRPVYLQYFREGVLLFRPDADSLPLYNGLYASPQEREKLISAQKEGLLLGHPVRE
jgi:hypothetical protein